MSPRTTRSHESILQLLKQVERAISAQDLYVELIEARSLSSF